MVLFREGQVIGRHAVILGGFVRVPKRECWVLPLRGRVWEIQADRRSAARLWMEDILNHTIYCLEDPVSCLVPDFLDLQRVPPNPKRGKPPLTGG